MHTITVHHLDGATALQASIEMTEERQIRGIQGVLERGERLDVDKDIAIELVRTGAAKFTNGMRYFPMRIGE